jgi:serine/threonine protein kinase/tetratricopeptide (TPR) repeat protein
MNEEEIFHQVLARSRPEEQAAYLEQACAGDPALRASVEALLRANVGASRFLDRPAPAPAAIADEAPIIERQGTVIGPYRLMEQIGEGGMGLVFVAEQQHPVRRKVALKVIKPGMDTRQVVARFEAERQALALMDHPNIAKVHDGGTTGGEPGGVSRGRPYFVMELVKGVPITEYCDQNQVSVRERLELFLQVCHAVQHAHQKGIIHRDIKPSNVLIMSQDGTPLAKVIDFGVAKAIGQQLTDKTIYTQFTQLVGTPMYMSPEQAGQSGLDVDTRTDIYAMGVLLYELLTGTTPFDRDRLKEADYDEIRRIIREEEPAKPSTRISTLGQAATTVSTNRKSDPRQLSRLFRGELDWIVMKALEKDRNRRYETANGFAMDVQRYLADEPVLACPPSVGYQLRKFVRRNKGPVLTVATVLVLLVGGIVGTAWGLVRAQRSATAERAANELTKKRLAQIEKGNEILSGIFADLDIQQVRTGKQPLERVLADHLVKAAEQLEGESVGDPLVVAALQERLGASLTSLGFPDRAIPVLEKSRQTRQEALGQDHADTLSSMSNLANAYEDAGELDHSLPLKEQMFKLQKARFGSDHPNTIDGMNSLAEGYRIAGKLDLALPLYEECLNLMRTQRGPDHPDTLVLMNNLAGGYLAAEKLDLAVPLAEETHLRMKRKLGPDHPNTISSMQILANSYQNAGKLDLAVPLMEETLALRKTKLGADHPHTLGSMGILANAYREAGQLAQALPLLEETLALTKVKLGPDHPDTLRAMNNLAMAHMDASQQDKAVPLLEQTLEKMKGKLGSDHPDTLITRYDLAWAYQNAGQSAKARAIFEQTLEKMKVKLGPDNPRTLRTMAGLAINYRDAGRVREAIPLLEEAFARGGKQRAAMRDWVPEALVATYEQAGQWVKAETLCRASLEQAKKQYGADDLRTCAALGQLGLHLLVQQKYADAEPLLRDCLKTREQKQPDNWKTFSAKSMLGGSLLGQKNYQGAEPLLLTGYAGMKKRENAIRPQGQIRLAEAADRLVELYTATNKPIELKQWQAERARYPQTKMSAPVKQNSNPKGHKEHKERASLRMASVVFFVLFVDFIADRSGR